MSYVIGTILVVAITFFLVRRHQAKSSLAREGVVTRGRVIRKFRRPLDEETESESGCIVYDFFTPGGQRVENSVFVGEMIYQVYDKGSEFEVVYLKDKPSVSGAKYEVDLSRAAMGMPPL